MSDDADVEQTLAEVQARVREAEAALAPRKALEADGRELLARLIRKRKHVQQRGVRSWEGAQRGALRMVTLAAGCVAIGTGAWALDPTLGGVSLVVSLVVLGFEGLR